MSVRFPALTFAALAALLFSMASLAADSPSSVVSGFYRKHLELRLSGAPTPTQLKQLAPYLSQHLQALLERAWAKRELDIKRAPDEKPAFAEGDLFTSLFEGPASFEILRTETLAHEYAVAVRFTYRSGGETSTWTDVVRVANKLGQLVIVNVEYGGNWDFAARGSLITALEDGALANRR